MRLHTGNNMWVAVLKQLQPKNRRIIIHGPNFRWKVFQDKKHLSLTQSFLCFTAELGTGFCCFF